jgi:uncharacterized repeat protein (TIGR01451 family)
MHSYFLSTRVCRVSSILPQLLLGATASLLLPSQSDAQQTRDNLLRPQSSNQQQSQTVGEGVVLHYPPSAPIITLNVNSPAEVRVGQTFDYSIQVTNSSDNIVVHDLVLSQQVGNGFEIESSELQQEQSTEAQDRSDLKTGNDQGRRESQSSPRSNADSRNDRENENDSSARSQTSEQNAEDNAEDRDAENQQSQRTSSKESSSKDSSNVDESERNEQSAKDNSRWKIARLQPGESRMINVTAVSDSEGTGHACVAIESYVPALCLTTRFTKPELELVKQAPRTADICEEIQFDYLVRNTGTGDLQKFTVRDELPEGLETVEGQKHLEFTLDDGLKAGETRKFAARLLASRTGDLSSRASVEGPDGVTAKSNRAGTIVQKANLAVAITGPQAMEAGGLANYVVRVTNTGDAPAPNALLRVYFPRSADLVRSSEPRATTQSVVQPVSTQARAASSAHAAHTNGNNQSDQNPQESPSPDNTANEEQPQGQEQPNSQPNQNELPPADSDGPVAANEQPGVSRNDMGRNQWTLGDLAPGQTAEVTYVLRVYEGGNFEQIAEAEYVCETARDQAMAIAKSKTSTEILMLSGLRLTVIDDRDPVPVGERVTYTITVLNQGNAPARKIRIGANMPETLEFVNAGGSTNGKNSEGKVVFEELEQLEPGMQATWQLVARVSSEVSEPTQSALEVELESEVLDETIRAEEPTMLFNQGDNTQNPETQDLQNSDNQ